MTTSRTPLAAQVADQEGQQVAGGLVGPVQVLDHQHQRGLLAQAAEQAEQQLEQPGLGGLAGRAAGLARPGRAAGGPAPRQDGPTSSRTASTPTSAGKGPQRLHDRGIGQGALADRHTAAGQHPRPVGGAAGGQFGDQAGLADAGLAPHQDDGRVPICGPPPGRLEELELLDAADEGRARHAAAHLAGIIPRDRPERNGGRKEPATKDGEPASVGVWQVPDSGDTPQRHSELASDDQSSTRSLEQAG